MLSLLLPLLIAANPVPGAFEFALPGLDSSPAYVDLSFLSPKPAGADGFVTIKNGQFVDGSGQRLKFLGTNMTFAGAFPEHDVAEAVAARMRKFGLNIVRFHHIDNAAAPRGLWLDAAKQDAFDPAQLDKLDYLIYQLKQHGIYINLNLHVSRNYAGVPFDELPYGVRYGKSIDYFDPRLIAMQKQYASMLLEHVNPYTKTAYKDEPAVVIVELNNENTLLGKAFSSDLQDLTPAVKQPLLDGWHGWLKNRYGTLDKVAAAWLVGTEPLGQPLFTDGDFAHGQDNWTLEGAKPGVAAWSLVPGAGPEGKAAARVKIDQVGATTWAYQVHRLNLNLEENRTYTLTFWGKADQERTLSVGTRLQQADWHAMGLSAQVTLKPEWQRFRMSFTAVNTEPDKARLSFNLVNQPGVVELAGVVLQPGADLGWPDNVTIDSVPAPIRNGLAPQKQDWVRYLIQVEHDYVQGLRDHLNAIGVKAKVIDTQASYADVGGVLREAGLSDFIDMHSYWQHPSFPGKPWDGNNWRIGNTPMVASESGGTLFRLASHRVAGMPFTVSEYDHPAPSLYAAEMFPVIGGYAALQDWDAVFQFTYGSSDNTFKSDRITGYFDLAPHAGKMVFAPVAAMMLRAGAVPPAASESVLSVPKDSIPDMLAAGQGRMDRLFTDAGAAPDLFANSRLAVKIVDGGGEPTLAGPKQATAKQFDWRPDGQDQATILGPGAAAVAGRIGGKTVKVGPLTVNLQPTERNFASVGLVALDGQPLEQSSKLLLVIAGAVVNQDMNWNDDFTTVGNKWGTGPTVAEALTAQIGVASKVAGLQVQRLNELGQPAGKVASSLANGALTFTVEPSQKTLWYAISK